MHHGSEGDGRLCPPIHPQALRNYAKNPYVTYCLCYFVVLSVSVSLSVCVSVCQCKSRIRRGSRKEVPFRRSTLSCSKVERSYFICLCLFRLLSSSNFCQSFCIRQ